jgi:NAD(P)-dependent dehydrogenase (short-subunit alcohol dehydrogenase family)
MNKKTIAVLAAGAWLAYRALRRTRRLDLQDKVALVSGGSRGLGLVIGRELIRQGARVAICARDAEELERARLSFAAEERERLLTRVCDVGDRDQVQAFVGAVREHWGPIDVLINNAGVISVGPIEVMDRDDYEESLKVHLWAALNTIEAVLPDMRERREGRIVNIASIGGKISVPHLVPYCTGKFALVGLSEGLRAELAKDGICVTTVCPGLMRTGSPRNAMFKGKHRLEYTWFMLSDSLPPFAMSAERAARKIIRALRNGDGEIVLSLPAKAAVLCHGMFPGLSADLLGFVNRLLPGPGGIQHRRVRGFHSESALTRSWLTGLTRVAERKNNERIHGDGHHQPHA